MSVGQETAVGTVGLDPHDRATAGHPSPSRQTIGRTPRRSILSERVKWGIPSVVTLIVLALVVLLPLAWIFFDSISDPKGDGFTLGNFVDAFSAPEFLRPVWNSVRLSGTVMILCVVIGVPLAWLVSRTDLPGAKIMRSAVYISFVLPSLITAVAWVLLASPNSGMLNKLSESIFGVKPLNVFSMTFLAVMISFSLFSYTFIFTVSSLDNVGGEVEEAAAIMGAGRFRRTVTIVLPLVVPAILSSMIVTFLQTIALYGAPALIAVPAGEQVITTQLFSFFAFPQRPELAAAYALPLVIFAAILIWLRKRIMGRRSYVTVGGRGGAPYKVKLGGWKWPAAVLSWGFFAVAVILPAGTLVYMALLRNWTRLGLDLNFDNFTWVFNNGAEAIGNSMEFALWTGTLCMVVGFIVAYLSERRNNFVNRLLAFLTTTPLVVPGMILAIGMLAAYSRPPILIYGTGIILIVAFWVRFMPIAFQNIQPAIAQINPELEQASRIGGAGLFKTMGRITLPLASGAMVSAWIFTFVLSTHEISAAMLLVGIDTQVMPTLVTNLYEQALYGRIAALGVVMVGITMIAVIIGRVLASDRFLGKRSK